MKEKVLQAMREFGAPVNAGAFCAGNGTIIEPFLKISTLYIYLFYSSKTNLTRRHPVFL